MYDREEGKSSITPFRAVYYMVKVTLSYLIIHFSVAISKLHQMNKKMAQEFTLMKESAKIAFSWDR
jgi:hypothetical protein